MIKSSLYTAIALFIIMTVNLLAAECDRSEYRILWFISDTRTVYLKDAIEKGVTYEGKTYNASDYIDYYLYDACENVNGEAVIIKNAKLYTSISSGVSSVSSDETRWFSDDIRFFLDDIRFFSVDTAFFVDAIDPDIFIRGTKKVFKGSSNVLTMDNLMYHEIVTKKIKDMIVRYKKQKLELIIGAGTNLQRSTVDDSDAYFIKDSKFDDSSGTGRIFTGTEKISYPFKVVSTDENIKESLHGVFKFERTYNNGQPIGYKPIKSVLYNSNGEETDYSIELNTSDQTLMIKKNGVAIDTVN